VHQYHTMVEVAGDRPCASWLHQKCHVTHTIRLRELYIMDSYVPHTTLSFKTRSNPLQHAPARYSPARLSSYLRVTIEGRGRGRSALCVMAASEMSRDAYYTVAGTVYYGPQGRSPATSTFASTPPLKWRWPAHDFILQDTL
jgi:hypothetical protein